MNRSTTADGERGAPYPTSAPKHPPPLQLCYQRTTVAPGPKASTTAVTYRNTACGVVPHRPQLKRPAVPVEMPMPPSCSITGRTERDWSNA